MYVFQYVPAVVCCVCSDVFKIKKFSNNDFILSTNHNISAKFSGGTGLLKTVSVGSTEVILDLDFVSYGTKSGKDKSGAYLFLPDKEASSIISDRKQYKIVTIAGPLVRYIIAWVEFKGWFLNAYIRYVVCIYICRSRR